MTCGSTARLPRRAAQVRIVPVRVAQLPRVPTMPPASSLSFTRRSVLGALSGLGIGSAAFQRALALQAAQAGKVTTEMIQQAEWIAGIELSEDDRKAIAGSVE